MHTGWGVMKNQEYAFTTSGNLPALSGDLFYDNKPEMVAVLWGCVYINISKFQ